MTRQSAAAVNAVHANPVQPLALIVLLISLMLLAVAAPVRGQANAEPRPDEIAAERCRQIHKELLKKHADDDNFFVKPGLIANRKKRTVTIHAWGTDLSEGAAVEFWLIPVESGKGYEALAITIAKPSDIHAALEFIGLEPGRPVNYARNEYWPKGERVSMNFTFKPEGRAKAITVPAESLIYDRRLEKSLPQTNFVFTGSYTYQENGKNVYAANHSDSMSIASSYNERSTVLDVPRMAFQSDVYSYLIPTETALAIDAGMPIEITLAPTRKPGNPRVVDLDLHVNARPGVENASVNQLRFALRGIKNQPVTVDNFTQLTKQLESLIEAERDPFVSLHVGDNVSLQAAQLTARLLRAMEGEQGIRIEAPPANQLYYMAYLPDEELRDRNKRLWRGHELRLHTKDGKVKGQLVELIENYEVSPPKQEARTHTVTSPEQLAEVVRTDDGFRQPLVIFAQDNLAVGQVRNFIQPVLDQSDPIYIFLPQTSD